MNDEVTKGSLLLDDEERIILKTRKLREDILNAVVAEDGIPTNNSTIRVLNEVMNSLDSQVVEIAKLRKDENIESDASILESVVGIMKAVSADKQNIALSNKNNTNTEAITIDDKFIPNKIVKDAMYVGKATLDISEIEGADDDF